MNRRRTLLFASCLVACALFVAGCGDAGGGSADSGYGASQPVPATKNCSDFCRRVGSCLTALCNEDTMSMNYGQVGDFLATQCLGTCSDSLLNSGISASQWQCYFQSSCRQVFGADVCHQNGHYSCQ